MTTAIAETANSPDATPGPLARLRALKRTGLTEAVPTLRDILASITDPLDLEAAGAMLRGDATRMQLASVEELRRQRIAILGSSTLDSLPPVLDAMLLRDGILADFATTDFNQWRFEIMSGAPTLRRAKPRVVACLLDDEAVFEGIDDAIVIDAIEARCAAFVGELRGWAQACSEAVGGRIVLSSLLLRPLRSDRFIDYRSRARLAAAWSRMNAEILSIAETQRDVVVLDLALIAARATNVFASDRMRHAAGHAYSAEFLALYAQELCRIARADLGLARKGLVLDLDNTLWGGVVGDVGVAGLTVGSAWPGAPHRELQALARDYATQGILLTACSKNDETLVREALRTHPEMLLREQEFAVVTANWEPKAGNVRAQAATLNIGRDALVFLDDHPVERGAMRSFLPEVETVEVPADPSSYAALLAARGAFNLFELSGEDRARNTLYRERAAREEAQANLSLDDYLRSLDSRLHIETLNALNVARIVQLFAKTNQFNLTGRRLTEAELRAPGVVVHAARLADRFGDNGLIAAIATETLESGELAIANIVLSCRVFSRGVEGSLMAIVLADARRRGAPALHGSYVPTPKNGRCADFLPSMGFEPSAEGLRHDLVAIPTIPDWINVLDDRGEARAA